MTIAAILKSKGNNVTDVAPDATIAEVTHTLAEHRIGAVVVTGLRGELLGILIERDIVRALATHGASTLDLHANELMTTHVTTATLATTAPEAMQMMSAGRFRHLPVLDQNRLVGLVSIGDVVKARMSAQDFEVDSLKAYVAGS